MARGSQVVGRREVAIYDEARDRADELGAARASGTRPHARARPRPPRHIPATRAASRAAAPPHSPQSQIGSCVEVAPACEGGLAQLADPQRRAAQDRTLLRRLEQQTDDGMAAVDETEIRVAALPELQRIGDRDDLHHARLHQLVDALPDRRL